LLNEKWFTHHFLQRYLGNFLKPVCMEIAGCSLHTKWVSTFALWKETKWQSYLIKIILFQQFIFKNCYSWKYGCSSM